MDSGTPVAQHGTDTAATRAGRSPDRSIDWQRICCTEILCLDQTLHHDSLQCCCTCIQSCCVRNDVNTHHNSNKEFLAVYHSSLLAAIGVCSWLVLFYCSTVEGSDCVVSVRGICSLMLNLFTRRVWLLPLLQLHSILSCRLLYCYYSLSTH